ncbi:MAG TPA: hypothetical protein PKA16_04580 [Ottowia sp.]|uniref:hypothetical protein n=1 Tax=Ottowia sp. TaxID=1898956 RepID=UPI002BB7477D|nr:hypothetical protein [Ottowia sp.]HMN20650.1 hypothetical protein [Ottowia sp.]
MTAYTKLSVAAATLLLAAGAQAACYTVMDAKGNIVSQTTTPPVDMSYQLHQTVPERYGPGASMVFGIADDNCGFPAEARERDAFKPAAFRSGGKARRAPKADRG